MFDILRGYGMDNCNKMIEVGSGPGWFCELAKEQNLAKKIIAIEPQPTFCNLCRKITGIEVIQSTIENYTQIINADLIINFELIAHLFSPRTFLETCYNGLNAGGLFICSTPNYFGLDFQILKEKHDSLLPNFLNIFNTKSIKILLNSIGFRKIKIITPGLLDIQIVMNKIRSGKIKAENYPLFSMLIEYGNEEFINELQSLLQKHKMSSHMIVSAQK